MVIKSQHHKMYGVVYKKKSINEYFIHNNGVASKLENVNHIKDLSYNR